MNMEQSEGCLENVADARGCKVRSDVAPPHTVNYERHIFECRARTGCTADVISGVSVKRCAVGGSGRRLCSVAILCHAKLIYLDDRSSIVRWYYHISSQHTSDK